MSRVQPEAQVPPGQPRSSMTDDERAAVAEGIELSVYRDRWKTLLVLCLALATVMLANTSLGVALPVLSVDLGATTSQQQWFNNAFTLVFAGLLFTASAMADRYGRKAMLQAGLVVFGLGSAYVWLFTDSSTELIAARAALGVGAAMVMPVTLSILTSVFPRHQRTRAVAVWAAVSGAGTALGPVVSGVLLEFYSWQSVFVINIPVVIVGVALGVRFVPGHRLVAAGAGEGGHGGIDPGGAVLSTLGIGTVVYALIQAEHNGWASATTLGLLAAGLVLVAVFVLWERRVKDPMLDMTLFRDKAFSASALSLTLVFFALIGVFFSLSLTLQLVFGYSPLMSSVAMLPVSVMMVLVSPQVARVVGRFGPRATVVSGMGLAALGMGILGTLSVDSGYWHLLFGLATVSLGIALTMPPATDMLMSKVPRERAGMGSATNDVTREIGASLGIAVLGSVLGSTYGSRLSDSLTGFPEDVRETATNSLVGGLGVARSLGEEGTGLLREVMESWMDGVRVAHLAATVLILIAVVVAWAWLPRVAEDMHRTAGSEGAGDATSSSTAGDDGPAETGGAQQEASAVASGAGGAEDGRSPARSDGGE
ncbi:MFS transporter [Actinoalloteichus caeruleus]|uniref:Drug resistance transporter, EmrB/QacA subfamily n=1 Tax=Actinoalloteichus caeruleus DSM 43889 TaxID=1120930 RepID=A0ABT1JKM2_ACTCY|nr:MFS transporter [Actinoalloteichus caeruleus]MCP2333057.1 drug resistance transporter, EmrB/QacA subfamily [Actinoalloteichus caeruleus DSM 43889]